QDRTESAIPAAVDLTAEQRARCAADDQSRGAVLLTAISAAIVTAPDTGIAVDRLAIRAPVVIAAIVTVAAVAITVATIAAVAVPAILGRRGAITGRVEIDRQSGSGNDRHARSSEGQGCFGDQAFHGLDSCETSSGRFMSTPCFLNGRQLMHS